MTGEVGFFELGVEDVEKARAFYGALFGWSFEPGENEGFMIRTPSVPGGVHGGDPGARPYLFFVVDDLDAALGQVRDLGGTVDDADVEGDEASQQRFGRFRLCKDDQGSEFGLHQKP